MDEDFCNEIHQEAKEFRRRKILEIQKKKKEGIATSEEISFINKWREMFKDEAF